MMKSKRAAIYHFTNESKKKPVVYQKQLMLLQEYAESHGLFVEDVFCDMDLHATKHPEFERFLQSHDLFDVLIVKDFYHISAYTCKCMEIMRQLLEYGIEIHTLENGVFKFDDIAAPLTKPLTVATYIYRHDPGNEQDSNYALKNDIFDLFINKKTKWTTIDQYIDKTSSYFRRNSDQKQLQELIQKRDRYDLLLVHGLHEINKRTAHFCQIREQLKLDIYSLQDGFLKYDKGD